MADASTFIVAMDINAESLFLHLLVKNTLTGVAVTLTRCKRNKYAAQVSTAAHIHSFSHPSRNPSRRVKTKTQKPVRMVKMFAFCGDL